VIHRVRVIAAALIGLVLATCPGPLAAAPKGSVTLTAAIDTTGSNRHETTFGDLLADALRATGAADIGLAPADEIMADVQIDPGARSIDDVVHSLRNPGDDTDTVVVLSLTGIQLQRAAERSVSREPQPFDGFLQVSGLQVRYDPSQPPGKRVTLANALGVAIVATTTYRVATTRPIAEGSLGYFEIWDKSDILSDTGVSVAKSLGSYLAGHPTLTPAIEGRITGL
jgi:5'-nucleotidase/UDP-sugar diphosphatase